MIELNQIDHKKLADEEKRLTSIYTGKSVSLLESRSAMLSILQPFLKPKHIRE
jgi:hypothetical protein